VPVASPPLPLACSLRRRPRRDTVLRKVVRKHLDDFRRLVRETYEKPLPRYVLDEFHAYLRCGEFRHGFTRAHCPTCGHVLLVPFSCKRRGICPSCAGRRMSATAVHLVDRVLPNVPIRQWVLSLPWELRRLAAVRADATRAFARCFADSIFAHFRRRFRKNGLCGAITFVQRAGGSLNLNVHFHDLVLDGVFRRGPSDRVIFRRASPPTREELAGVVANVRARCLRWLRREGLAGEADDEPMAGDEAGPLDGFAQAAMQRGTIASLPADGEDPVDAGADSTFGHRPSGRWSADVDGFSLHAGVRIEAGDFEGRERLVRYAARPSFAVDRLRELEDGRLAYRVRWATSSAGPYRIMTPVELLARLAAIVPPPRYPLVRYHGVLAPASKWRALVVPKARDGSAACGDAASPRPGGQEPATHGEADDPLVVRPSPPGPVRSVLLRVPVELPEEGEYTAVIPLERWSALMDGRLLARSPRIDWATLLRRTFAEDVLVCPRCRGRLQVLEVVTKPNEAQAMLAALGVGEADGVEASVDAVVVPAVTDPRRERAPPTRRAPACIGSS
jgi:hypothetical protein